MRVFWLTFGLFVWLSWLQELLFQICTRTLKSRSQIRKFGICSYLSWWCTSVWNWFFFFFNYSILEANIWSVVFSIRDMYNHVSERSGQKAALIADDVYEVIMKVIFYSFLNIMCLWWSIVYYEICVDLLIGYVLDVICHIWFLGLCRRLDLLLLMGKPPVLVCFILFLYVAC